MLVYANHFTLASSKHENSDSVGSESSTAAFRSVVGWLSKKTGRHFSISELLISGEFQESIYQVKIYTADRRDPKIYSVLLTHRDEKIFGRFWSTEISIRLTGDSTFISILLETEEISTRVEGEVAATRPMLINYLARNAEFSAGTVGLRPRNLSNSDEDYRALSYEIEKTDRTYPLVLVSCFEGRPLIDPEYLQEQLFGLAQVIYADENNDSWKMAEICGRNYSAWGGAVNIIFPYAAHKGFCYTNLMRRELLEEIRQEERDLFYEILARVTHSTNPAKRRQHFSSADVRAKRQKDHLLYLREQIEHGQDNQETLEQLLTDADKELKEHKETSDKLLEEADKEREDAVNEANKLRYGAVSKKADEQQGLTSGSVAEILAYFGKKKDCTPEQCLEFAEQILSDKIIVLESAKKAAREAADYQNPHILLEAVYKLGNEFLSAYLKNGDVKSIFGTKIYAAKESEQTMKNRECARQRTFSYNGRDITMWQHLGWGVADDERKCLRLYFYVDQKDKKIVIGHCGAHLDTINTGRI